jgi:hypothetical protein
MWRWVRREPWMALTASIATLCAITLGAIRWLAVLGVLRDYAVAHTSGSVTGGYTASPIHRQLGLLSGPSDALTDVDYWAWKIGFIAGVLWLLRLALRSANHRIGVLRTLGIVLGLGAFVATGVAHHIVDCVVPSGRARWMNRLITLWCFAAVFTVLFYRARIGSADVLNSVTTMGAHVELQPIGWSIAGNAMQLLVVIGGWSIAACLTRHWVRLDERADGPRALLSV